MIQPMRLPTVGTSYRATELMPPVVTFYKNRQNLLHDFGELSGFMYAALVSMNPVVRFAM